MSNRIKDTAIVRRAPFLNLEKSQQVKREIDDFLDTKIIEWNNTVPSAKHLENKEINQDYYKQTLIEHSWRIRLMRTVQCNALHKISQTNAEAAQLYAAYQDEEMLHDTLFMQDAESLGIAKETIFNTEPSFYTRLLSGFLYFIAEHEKPVGVVCYSYLVEYTTQKITPKQIKALSESIGKDKISGQAAHLNTDLVEDHTQDMWDILSKLIESEEDIQDVKRYLAEIQELLKMFFVDMHNKYIKE
ncbi:MULTISPECIES: iron-containing redox enzyme family protein [Rahnella]|uniref:Iron-containing redox enzyme family protein n=1 Tax=Rahnella ecdela TaxID=2816250 RepID=A0ABS6LBD3_9GAMM|nr:MULTISPECIES: iron-containing redox enzyme family protein [Rahnella]MBU9844035.1 iron-containing redox enzyme family protein [Rahnella ecdela]